jgi:1,4-dihydroxy-2-naphthoyl-CoA hydrolase
LAFGQSLRGVAPSHFGIALLAPRLAVVRFRRDHRSRRRGYIGAPLTDRTFEHFDAEIAAGMLRPTMGLGGLPTYLAIRHTELSAGRLVAEMDAREELLTPFGNLHGGCLSAFVDHCLGVVFYPVIPKGAWVATTEFKLNLIKPVSAGICQATAQVLALAKRSGVARIDIVNDDQLVCAAQGTVTVVLPKTR